MAGGWLPFMQFLIIDFAFVRAVTRQKSSQGKLPGVVAIYQVEIIPALHESL
jgi:hypothetical protein